MNKLYQIIFLWIKAFTLFFIFSKNYSQAKSFDFNSLENSVFIYNMSKNKILYEKNPLQKLIPASVTKSLLAALLLDKSKQLSEIKTSFYTNGEIQNGVLKGDLIFLGSGDPYLTNEKLWGFVTDLQRFGIEDIQGRLVINNFLFSNISDDIDRKLGLVRSRNSYNSQLSSTAINFGVLAVTVTPKKNGQNAYLNMEPFLLPHFKIEGHVKTVSSEKNTHINLERLTKNGTDIFSIRGQISQTDPFTRIYRSVGQGELYTAEVLDAFLNSSGIKTNHKFIFSSAPLKNKDKFLISVSSYPINYQINAMMNISNNFIADMYTMKMAQENDLKINTLKQASTLIKNYVSEVTIKTKIKKNQPEDSSPYFESGSGLTATNRVSSYEIVSVLTHMFQNKKMFPIYYVSFPSPQDEGSTLRRRFENFIQSPIIHAIRAKTGTLSDEAHVVTLAGYTRLENDDWISFSILLNDLSRSVPIEQMRKQLDDELSKFLTDSGNLKK